jgi:hypothetical protein
MKFVEIDIGLISFGYDEDAGTSAVSSSVPNGLR